MVVIWLIHPDKCCYKLTIKLNSYSYASIFFFYHFVACTFPFFEVKKRLTDRSISKALPQKRYRSMTELNKVQFQKRFMFVTQDFIGHLKNALHEHFIASSAVWVWMKTLQLIAKDKKKKKNASVQVWIQLNSVYHLSWIHTRTLTFFYHFIAFHFFEVISV